MSLWLKVRGTIETILQLGIDGPQIKNNSSVIEARSSTDAAFVKVRGADPAADDDLVTKRYGDANYAGAAVTVTQVEVDFGTACDYTGVFVITDAGVTATSKIDAWQAGDAATGRVANENEMDGLVCSCLPAAGTFTLVITAVPGPVVGKYKVNYLVSA